MFEEEKNFKNSKAKLLTNKKILEYFTNVLIPKLSDTNNNYKFLKK
ncbi:MAG: hypothetical protein U9Q99_03155 [Nanoarchaeota archaeon]|nr:hypothetical protein [Nanoarchaeota archaeon]